MRSNKKAGNDFEKYFCQMLAMHGFWCHNMANNKNGQPADVIASKNDKPFLIDCKDCENDVFVLSRIEENQHYAMSKWEMCGNGQGLFALNTSDGVYMIKYGRLQALECMGHKSLTLNDMKEEATRFVDWVAGYELCGYDDARR